MRKTFFFVILAVSFFACTNNNKNAQSDNKQEPAEAATATIDVPENATVLNQSADGNQVLFVDYTDEDRAFNNETDPELLEIHNTLFMLDKKANSVKTILTTSDNLPEQCFSCDIQEAWFSKDERRVFIVNNPSTGTYFNVLYYDLKSDKLVYLSDGEGLEEGDDGLYYVEGAKDYDIEEGAFWFTKIVTPDGTMVGGRDTIF